MNGPLAQIVALTCHGNAFLQGLDTTDFFPDNSSCTFCDRVSFALPVRRFLRRPELKETAPTPQAWFGLLREGGASGIRLFRVPGFDRRFADRVTAGLVGGGGTWTMDVRLPGGRSEYWTSSWEVWDQDAPERRIWRVTYIRAGRGFGGKLPLSDLPAAAARLVGALEEIHSFSQRYGCDPFTGHFANALETLASAGGKRHGFHRDLSPVGLLTPEAEAVLDACQSAWVFGGMGSWNDLWFDGDGGKEYQRVSERLFQDLNTAIAAAVAGSCAG